MFDVRKHTTEFMVVTHDDIERWEKYRDMIDILWMQEHPMSTLRRQLFAESQMMTSRINRLKKFL